MQKIDWKKKLTSRKFWLAVGGFVAGIIILICNNEALAEQISAIILSAGSVIAYIIGEGLADASYNQANVTNTNKNITVYSDVDGNDVNNIEQIAGSIQSRIVPTTTGRDGITVDGNEDEG